MNGALNVNGAVTATNFSGSGTGLTGIGAHAGTGAGPRWKAPRQSSSGGKERLGRVSKMGNRYLRKLLVVGAHAVLYHRKSHEDAMLCVDAETVRAGTGESAP